MKQLILMLIVASSLGATALPSLADNEDYQTSINDLSTERRSHKQTRLQAAKDAFDKASSSNVGEDKLGNFEINDLMSTYPQDRDLSRIYCVWCKVKEP